MTKRNVRARSIDGKKVCYKCSTWKEESEFAKRKTTDDGLNPECRKCTIKVRLPMYGLTWDQYEQMVIRQNGVCAICLKPPGRAFDIDHDHACCAGGTSCGKCVRGLLCFNCNSALGKLKDDVEALERAVIYLKNF
jgi:hypothetical protein